MDGFMGSVVAIAGLLVGAAVVATLVSKNAQTGQVISSGFGGFSQALGVALSPVTGGSFGTASPSYQTF
jgi:ABC-type Mn2+/Zn2+ transport system permease subunit